MFSGRRSRRTGSGDGDDDDASSASYTQYNDSDVRPTIHSSSPPAASTGASLSSLRSNPTSPLHQSRAIYGRTTSSSSNASSTAASPRNTSFFPASTSPTWRRGALRGSGEDDADDDDTSTASEQKDQHIPMTTLTVPATNSFGAFSSHSPPVAASTLSKSSSFTSALFSGKPSSVDENKQLSSNGHSSSSSSSPAPSNPSTITTSSSATPLSQSTGPSSSNDADIDLDELEDEEAQLGEQGPLLKDYHSSTSSIRKDYTTVDWYFTKHNLGRIRRMIRLTNKAKGWKGKAMNLFIAAQGWIILFFVGVLTAASASFIHLVCEWLIDIKEGYCEKHGFFTTRRVCCMVPNDCGWLLWEDLVDEGKGGYWLGYFMYILFALPMAVCASWFVHIYSKAAARSGLSEMKVMLGGFIIKKFLGIRTVMIKALGVILGVSSGLHIGKLGPLVHIACCWGNIFGRHFTKYNTNEVKKREILSASVSAGVAAAFGSPIGGVLFSLESLSSYFPPQTMWRSFWCSITATLVLSYIDPFQTGKLVQFGVTSNANQWNWREVPIFALVGCLGGFIGALFNVLNIKLNLYRKKHKWLYLHPVREVFFLSLITSIINFPNIYLRGSMSALLAQLFTNCRDVNALNTSSDNVYLALCGNSETDEQDVPLMVSLLLCATIIKFFFTAMTYGCNVPGGVFMPGLVMGAGIGRMVGWGLQLQFESVGPTGFFSQCFDKTYCVSPGLYAIIGAAAVLTGITRLTVSLAIVIYEITGGLEYITPIMVTIVCAKWSADALGKQGLYAQRINKLHGYPWIDAYAEMELIGPAMDIMSRDLVCLTVYGMNLYTIKNLLQQYPYHGFPIIDNQTDRLIYGYIARSDLELLIEQNNNDTDPATSSKNPFVPVHFSHDPPPYPTPHFLDFSGSVDKYVIRILPHTPIDRVLGLFQGLGLRYVLVNGHKGGLLGIIKKKDMLVYIREQNGGATLETTV